MRVAIGLGSNLGDRIVQLQFGARRLQALLENVRCSSVYETRPMHRQDQPLFLNACCAGRTRLDPLELLRELKEAERDAGRRGGGSRYGPRELDLDILLYGEEIVDRPGLQVPHPRLAERAFALIPLDEIAPGWIHPALGATITELAGQVDDSGLCRTDGRLSERAQPDGLAELAEDDLSLGDDG